MSKQCEIFPSLNVYTHTHYLVFVVDLLFLEEVGWEGLVEGVEVLVVESFQATSSVEEGGETLLVKRCHQTVTNVPLLAVVHD